MNSKHNVTVGLLWHSLTSGNLGVGALTESNIAIIREQADKIGVSVTFLVLGSATGVVPELEQELHSAGHKLESHKVRVFRKSFRDLVNRCDFVIDIGEGDSFADIYGFERFFYHWLSKNIVCSLGKNLIFAPQTIGPFGGGLARFLARQIMRRSIKIFSRDYLSTAYLGDLGMKNNCIEAIDVAFRLPFVKSSQGESKNIRVGINVSGLLLSGGYTGANQFDLTINYSSFIRKVIDYFHGIENVDIYLVPHVIERDMPVEDDVKACEDLKKEFSRVNISPIFSRPSEAKSFISTMDFFIGARMHACIAAFSSGVPVVPVAYSRKFNGLFGSLGYDKIIDAKKVNDEDAFRIVVEAYSSRAVLKAKVDEGIIVARNKLSVYSTLIGEQLGRSR
jgi:colanic acid/amylovoran biosynthesis protein